jgi:dTMP kinase
MFIVLESIDGGGKGKQREEITSLIEETYPTFDLKSQGFPLHNDFYNVLTHRALQGEIDMNNESWILAFLLDKTLETDNIWPYVGSNSDLYLADGYFTTTIAYQAHLMGQIDHEKLLSYAKDFRIPKPDLNIFIDVDPEVAMKRKAIEEGHDEGLDMFERSIDKQKRLREIYNLMSSRNEFGEWVKIDGNGSIDEVKSTILEVIKKNVNLGN